MRLPRHAVSELFRLSLSSVLALALGHAAASADPKVMSASGMSRAQAPKAAPAPTAPAPISGPRLSDLGGTAVSAPALPAESPALTAPPDAAETAAPAAGSNMSRGGVPPRAFPTEAPGESAWDLTARARERALAPPRSGAPAGAGTGSLTISGAGSTPTTIFRTAAVPMDMLYVVADVDDPAFRAAIAGYTSGLVDYFDARAATPTAAQLSAYDCVFTHSNFLYADPVLLGDRLADYVDAGGRVILGMAHSVPWEIMGRIRTPGYDPVTTGGAWPGPADSYAGNGTTSYYAGVLSLTLPFQEPGVVLQGPGAADGSYTGSGEILLAYRPDGRVVYVNGTGHFNFGGTGDWAKLVANACMLARPGAHAMLHAVADFDDPNFRSDVALRTMGIVDYYDVRTPTSPSAALLATYDCVYVHLNFALGDPVVLGDRVADFVDAGGKAILGIGCTSAFGGGPPALGGRIMTPAYCPVTSPGGALDFSVSSYAGDGTTSYHAGILTYTNNVRDVLVLQGAGAVDGHFLDGDIAVAYRPDGRVSYINGAGTVGFPGSSGEWAKLVANACMLESPAAHTMLFAIADPTDDVAFRMNTAAHSGGIVDYFDASAAAPSLALLNTYDCVFTHPNFGYFDAIATGDNLADFVDGGGKVILGIATGLGFLGGRIVTPAYNPVVSTALEYAGPEPYFGDGSGPLYAGVGPFATFIRDRVTVQGAGIANGHYDDAEVAAVTRPDGRVVYLNGTGRADFGSTGDWPRLVANACTEDLSTGHRMLYAPSEADDPAHRAAIAQLTGGTVDYFAARFATPSAALLSTYDCVYTWANFAYSDRVLFGDRLADFADAGGKVVLGAFCTYTIFNSLGGRIMTPAYSPVTSPSGDNHFSSSAYLGDGTTCFHRRVFAYDQFIRDILALQGDGVQDGRYADGEIALAYRPDRQVVYLNGAAGAPLTGGGNWPQLIANAALCDVEGGQMLASSGPGALYNVDLVTGRGYGIGPMGGCSTEIEYLDGPGQAWSQACAGGYAATPFSLTNGAPTGAGVPNGAAFTGLEYAIGRLFGASFPGAGICLASTFGTLDPGTGTSVAIGPPAGLWTHPIVGLAYDGQRSTLYGLTSGCMTGSSDLVEIDPPTGAAVLRFGLPFRAGSLEFGPDGDLYGGGDAGDGGNLYRINPSTGAVALVGNPGFGSITGLTHVPAGAVSTEGVVAGNLSLAAPFPNPSLQGLVRLEFTLPQPGDANIELYNVAGRRVWSHAMGSLPAGRHSTEWNGFDDGGRRAPSGVYFVRLRTSMGDKRVSLVRLD